MAQYAIGDLQGCYKEFRALLKQIAFNPATDRLFLVGDLVNRGPDSLGVLRWVYAHRHAVHIVLGNHDLRLLAAHAGLVKLKDKDTLAPMLSATDTGILLNWLRRQPLARRHGDYLFVHAGLLPAWTAEKVLMLAREVSSQLAAENYSRVLAVLSGAAPAHWHDELEGAERLKVITHVLTRVRMLAEGSRLDVDYSGLLVNAPGHLHAWFDAPDRRNRDVTVVCGHWSALGLLVRDDIIALDTGCVWGGMLTAIRLEDGKIFQEPSRQPRVKDLG